MERTWKIDGDLCGLTLSTKLALLWCKIFPQGQNNIYQRSPVIRDICHAKIQCLIDHALQVFNVPEMVWTISSSLPDAIQVWTSRSTETIACIWVIASKRSIQSMKFHDCSEHVINLSDTFCFLVSTKISRALPLTWYCWALAGPDVFLTYSHTFQSYFFERLKMVQSGKRNLVNLHIPMSPQTNGTTIPVLSKEQSTMIIVTFGLLTPISWGTKPNRPSTWKC